MSSMYDQFKSEMSRVENLGINLDQAYQAYLQLNSYLNSISFEDCAFDIVTDEFLKLTLKLNNNRIMMITKLFVDLSNDLVVYSIFIDRNLIAAGLVSLVELKEYLDQ